MRRTLSLLSIQSAAWAAAVLVAISLPSVVLAKPPSSQPTTPAKSAKGEAPSADAYVLDHSPSKVILRMKHVPLGRFDTSARDALRGTFMVNGTGEISASVIELSASDLKSVIPLRDDHMKEKYLEIKKFEVIRLHQFKSTIPKDSEETLFTGTLKVKNQESPVQGNMKWTRDGKGLKGSGHFTSNLNALKIEIPQYMGVGVEPDFEVFVEFKAAHAIPDIPAPTL